MKEIWRDIPDYEGLYQVSNIGRIKNKTNLLKQSEDKVGYLRVYLYKNKKRKTEQVHRMVAKAFIRNDSNLPQVNHKDGNKQNNTTENLEWITAKNNSIHAVKIGSIKTKPVVCLEINKIYISVNEAERQTGIHCGHICKVCRGERKIAGGYHWRYYEAN